MAGKTNVHFLKGDMVIDRRQDLWVLCAWICVFNLAVWKRDWGGDLLGFNDASNCFSPWVARVMNIRLTLEAATPPSLAYSSLSSSAITAY